jgi:hypothetical protein
MQKKPTERLYAERIKSPPEVILKCKTVVILMLDFERAAKYYKAFF